MAGTHSRLLGLAAELRNNIYHFVVFQEDEIEVTDSGKVYLASKRYGRDQALNGRVNLLTDHRHPIGIPEPGLLSTCKQIRAEATAMYYATNKFSHNVVDYNSLPLMKWQEKTQILQAKYRVTPIFLWDYSSSSVPNRQNLILWLKRHVSRLSASALFLQAEAIT
jgi:hypothetical protein